MRTRLIDDAPTEALLFRSNLQDSQWKVDALCGLEASRKISMEQCVEAIGRIYADLLRSRDALGLGEEPRGRDHPR